MIRKRQFPPVNVVAHSIDFAVVNAACLLLDALPRSEPSFLVRRHGNRDVSP